MQARLVAIAKGRNTTIPLRDIRSCHPSNQASQHLHNAYEERAVELIAQLGEPPT